MLPSSSQTWLRYRLRTLLILVAVLAIPLAWVAKERRQSVREMQIADQLRDQGIRDIEIAGPYDWNMNGKPGAWRRNLASRVFGKRILSISSSGEELRLDDLSSIGELSCVRSIWLTHAPVHDLAPLANLTGLQYLYLYNSPVSDLTPLAKLTYLSELLIMNCTAVSDEAVAALQARLPKLKIKQ